MSTPTLEQQPAAQPAPPPPLYPDLETWVAGYFTPMFLHRVTGNPRVRWCSRWWEHAEVIARLTLLWNGWEGARWEPAAKQGWWLDLDHHLPLLLDLDGPFRACRHGEPERPAKHTVAETLDLEPAPEGWWD